MRPARKHRNDWPPTLAVMSCALALLAARPVSAPADARPSVSPEARATSADHLPGGAGSLSTGTKLSHAPRECTRQRPMAAKVESHRLTSAFVLIHRLLLTHLVTLSRGDVQYVVTPVEIRNTFDPGLKTRPVFSPVVWPRQHENTFAIERLLLAPPCA